MRLRAVFPAEITTGLVVVVDGNEMLPFKRGGVSDGNLEGNAVSGKDLQYVTQRIAQATKRKGDQPPDRNVEDGGVRHRSARHGTGRAAREHRQHGKAPPSFRATVTYCHICFARMPLPRITEISS